VQLLLNLNSPHLKNGDENILRRDCYTVLLTRLEEGRAMIADIPMCL